jgi:hypothetical protein
LEIAMRRFILMLVLIGLLIGCTAAPTPQQAAPPPTHTNSPAPTPTDVPITPSPDSSVPLVAGQWNELIYYPPLERVILVNGGPDRGKPADDPLELWAWDGSQWTLISADPNGPRWRNFAGATYDSARNVVVVYGGLQNSSVKFTDTWEWDGQTWTEHRVDGPGEREDAGMVYDAARGKVVLFGGASQNFEMMGDTWEWDGSAWAQVATSGPSPRFPTMMIYDAAREKVLMLNGHYVSGNGFENYVDFWEWDGTAWSEIELIEPHPGLRLIGQLVYDPLNERVLLFGGGDNSFETDLWSWDGEAWTQLAPDGVPPRSGAGGAYDVARNRVIMFGGVERPGGQAVTDTWEWDREVWQCVHSC